MAETAEPEAPDEVQAAFDTGAAAMAAALDEARDDPSLRGEVSAFFQAQRRLIEAQAHHLHVQLRQLHLKTVSDIAKLGLLLASLVALLVLVAAVGAMVGDAMNDHGLVIERFTVPPELAARGLTGETLAEDLLGRIDAIRRQANANSITVSDDIRSGGADTLKVEIPQTGLSLGEVDRFLHAQLGHASRLNGEMVGDGKGGIALDLHLSRSEPIRVEGAADNLEPLLQQAAEQAFAAFDPVNYVLYERSLGRDDEGLAAARRNVETARTPFDLANALGLYAAMTGERRRSLALARLAIDADPKVWAGWWEAAGASRDLGHDGEAVAYLEGLLKVRPRDQWRNHRPSMPYIFQTARIAVDRARGDFGRFAEELQTALPIGPDDVSSRALAGVEAMAGEHDCAAAAHDLLLAQAVGIPSPAEVATGGWRVALCRDDSQEALAAAQALAAGDQDAAAHAPGDLASRAQLRLRTTHLPLLAKARALTGDVASAEAAIATTPLDCYLCVRVRGQVAAQARDWPAADRWFAEAARQAPSLPAAYAEWGEARLARGDLAGAIAKFALAHEKGPRYADPLKGWGDALARQGRWGEARERYDQALALAPAWQALIQARAAVARRLA
jgi:tetratricopeptide (TPR) repeat protein